MMKIENVRLYTGEAYYEHGAVLVEGARIAYAGDMKDCPIVENTIDGRGGILMPALFNAHTHTPMTLLRGVGSDLSLMDWLQCIFPLEDKLDEDAVYWGTQLAQLEMIRRGTIGYADMYFFMDAVARASIESGMKASLARGCNTLEGVEDVVRLHKEFHGEAEGRIRIPMGLHAEYTSDKAIVKAAVAAAEKMESGFHTHLSESLYEHKACIERHGVTPARYFHDLGALKLNTIVAHCVHVTDEDIELFEEDKTFVSHCPVSNMKLASGFAPVVKMREAGIEVGIGNDGVASNNVLDMFAEMRMAALIAKGHSADPTVLLAIDVIRMATQYGARAMGFLDTGLLRAGMKADLVLLDGDAENLMPGLDIKADIVFAAEGLNVVLTMADGRVLYDHGEYKTLDEEKIKAEFKKAAQRMRD